MKLRVHCFFFLVFLHIQTDGKNKLFFYNHINIQIRRFFSKLVESNSLGKSLGLTSLAIHYSQNVFLGFSILVCIGVQVFFGGYLVFFTPPLAHVARSCARLALTSV